MSNKWLMTGLIISVVLNLLLVGFMAGRISGNTPFAGGRMDPTTGYVRLLRFLPEQRREAVAPIVRPMMGELMPALRSLRGDHRAVHAALAADPFDPEALATALSTLREHLSASQATAHRTLVELASALTAEERGQLAEAMRRPPHNMRNPPHNMRNPPHNMRNPPHKRAHRDGFGPGGPPGPDQGPPAE